MIYMVIVTWNNWVLTDGIVAEQLPDVLQVTSPRKNKLYGLHIVILGLGECAYGLYVF